MIAQICAINSSKSIKHAGLETCTAEDFQSHRRIGGGVLIILPETFGG